MHEKHWICTWTRRKPYNEFYLLFQYTTHSSGLYRDANVGRICSLRFLLHLVKEYFIWGKNSIIWAIEATESRNVEGKLLTGVNIQKVYETLKGGDVSLGVSVTESQKTKWDFDNYHNRGWIFIFAENGLQGSGKDSS